MKKLKKLLSIVLAVAMVLSLVVVTSADENDTTSTTPTTYTITIKNETSSYTYAAYQIFAGDLYEDTDGSVILSNITWGSGVNTTEIVSDDTLINAIQKIELETEVTIGTTSTKTPFSDCSTAAEVAEVLSVATGKDSEIAEKFAEVVGDYLADTATSTSSYADTDSDYEISNLSAGYYLVKTAQVPSGNEIAYTAYILEVVKDVTVTEKKSVPSMTKTVDDVNDSTGDTSTGNSADYDIGDDVPFTLTATLDTYYEKYTEYALTFHDTLSSGLSLNSNSVVVTVYTPYDETAWGSDTYYTYDKDTKTFAEVNTSTVIAPNENTDYYIGTRVASSNGGYEVNTSNLDPPTESLQVVIANTNRLYDGTDSDPISVTSGSIITVDYTAKLEDDALYQETNEVYIEYSNDPNGTGTGTSTPSLTYVYTYSLTVTKKDGDNNDLTGAAFALYKYELYTGTIFDTSTTYYTLDTTNNVFKVASNPPSTSGETYCTKKIALTETTTSYGNTFQWDGLDDGYYELVETTTPSGYNTIEPVYFMISATHDESDVTALTIYKLDGTTELSGQTDPSFTTTSDGKITTTVINESGSNLPETGGIGVTIFYVVGGILILAAAGVIVINRKKIKK